MHWPVGLLQAFATQSISKHMKMHLLLVLQSGCMMASRSAAFQPSLLSVTYPAPAAQVTNVNEVPEVTPPIKGALL